MAKKKRGVGKTGSMQTARSKRSEASMSRRSFLKKVGKAAFYGTAAAGVGAIGLKKYAELKREVRKDAEAHLLRAPERGGPLEKALENYGEVTDYGPSDAKKTVYIIPQLHPNKYTFETDEKTADCQKNIHFILDELGRRGAWFLHGEGAPNERVVQRFVNTPNKPGGWQRWLEDKTNSGDEEAVRRFYQEAVPGSAYFVRERWKPDQFRLSEFGQREVYGGYLEGLYGEFNRVVEMSADPVTGQLNRAGREEADAIARKIWVVNKFRSHSAADALVESAERGDAIGVIGGSHVEKMLERIKTKHGDRGIRVRLIVPKGYEGPVHETPMRAKYASPADGSTIEITHGEPTESDMREVREALKGRWDSMRGAYMTRYGMDPGEWVPPE